MSYMAGDNIKAVVGQWMPARMFLPWAELERLPKRVQWKGHPQGTVIAVSIRDTSHLAQRVMSIKEDKPRTVGWMKVEMWTHECPRLDITFELPVSLGCNYCGMIKT